MLFEEIQQIKKAKVDIKIGNTVMLKMIKKRAPFFSLNATIARPAGGIPPAGRVFYDTISMIARLV